MQKLAWRVSTTTLLIAPEVLSVMSLWMMMEPIVPAPITAKFLYPDMFLGGDVCCRDIEVASIQFLLFNLLQTYAFIIQ